NSVVLFVRSNKSYVNNAIVVPNGNHEPIFVPLNIEDDPVVGDDTRVAVNALYNCGRFPVGLFCVTVPREQWLSCVGVLLPELAQPLATNDAHVSSSRIVAV